MRPQQRKAPIRVNTYIVFVNGKPLPSIRAAERFLDLGLNVLNFKYRRWTVLKERELARLQRYLNTSHRKYEITFLEKQISIVQKSVYEELFIHSLEGVQRVLKVKILKVPSTF